MVKNESDKGTKAKYNISRAWVSEELESRFDVNKVMNLWVENRDGRTYHEVLLQAVKDIIKKQNV
jgi:frataxin-like iron-binding protein CyaY